MWKPNWAARKPLPTIKFVAAIALSLSALVACSQEPTPFVQPTQTLLQAAVTDTPSPLPPTPTGDTSGLAAPGDIVRATPADTAPEVNPDDAATPEDPVAVELVNLARRRVAEDLGLATRRVRLVEVTAYTWPDTSLGCPVDGESYAALEVDGYRIVLEAAETEYIFHTDVDRAVPCNPDNEQLPTT